MHATIPDRSVNRNTIKTSVAVHNSERVYYAENKKQTSQQLIYECMITREYIA